MQLLLGEASARNQFLQAWGQVMLKRKSSHRQQDRPRTGCCTFEGHHGFGANCSNVMKLPFWSWAPVAQCSQDEPLLLLNPWTPQDAGSLNCQARDRGITVCLQGLKGCDQKKQKQD